MIGIFATVLAWLASNTGNAAKAGESLEFRFEPPPKVPAGAALPFIESEVGIDVLGRVCCALGTSDRLEFGEVGFHAYRPRFTDATMADRLDAKGGRNGYVYTRRGGFIDLGHARDYIDYTRFFAARYYNAPSSGRTGILSKVFEEGGDIHLEIAPRTGRPGSALAAAMGAKLAYERAIWHEIITYFAPTGTLTFDERFSSFAPEDNFSNAVGVLAGYRALLTPDTPFDLAAQQALHKILARLAPVHRKEETQAAIDFVEDHWWAGGGLTPPAKRRNFDAFSPVRPWLVTDIVIPGKEGEGDELRETLARPKPASIHLPVQHDGLPLDSLAHLEMKNVHPSLRTLVPSLTTIKGSDLPTVVAAIRAEERRVKGADADSPGQPV
jgi:hypothetical protein